MKNPQIVLLLASLFAGSATAQDAQVTPLRNASDTQPAKFIVVLVKHKGVPVLEPINPTSANPAASPKTYNGEKK